MIDSLIHWVSGGGGGGRSSSSVDIDFIQS